MNFSVGGFWQMEIVQHSQRRDKLGERWNELVSAAEREEHFGLLRAKHRSVSLCLT